MTGETRVKDVVGIGKAAWKLEDAFRGEKDVADYPNTKEARDLYIEAAGAEADFRRSLLFMVLLSIMETPSWCNTEQGWFFPGELMDPLKRCELKGVEGNNLMLSGVMYIPPGWALVIECVLMYFIVKKLRLEKKLQTDFFDPLAKPGSKNNYVDMRMVNFGLGCCAFELFDCFIFIVFRPNWRLAFIARTGYLCLLPAVQSLFLCLKKVIVEFLSIASFLAGTIIFFAWIVVTIAADWKDVDKKGIPTNKGFDSFSASLYTMFVAGATDDFVSCFLRSYTAYRWTGLLWLMFLIIVQVLLLSLVLDTLVAAYTTFREHLEEDAVKKNVLGIMETFDILIQSHCGDSKGNLTKESFMDFVYEFGRSPRARRIDPRTAEIMFTAVDSSNDGAISKPEFGEICGVMEYELWTTKKYSNIKENHPDWWNNPWMTWFVSCVDGGSFDVFMNCVLLVNLVLVITETSYDLWDQECPPVISKIELVFSMLYVGEVALRLCVYSWAEYWSYRSNQFDFFTTWALLASSVVETVVESSPTSAGANIKRYMNILRLLRLLRVIKQLKQLKVVQFMVDTIMKLVSASKEVLIPLGVIVFFFTTLSVQLWGGLLYIGNPHLEETEYAENKYYVLNHNDFLMALGVWVVALLCEYVPEFAESIYVTADHKWTWFVYFIFYVLGVSIVFELVKAFTIEVFVELTKRQNEKREEKEEREEAGEGSSSGGGDDDDDVLPALLALQSDFELKGEQLHYRNIGDVMMQEKMKEAFEEIKERMEEEEAEEAEHGHAGHGHH